ncbi:hypothetical protein KAK06_18945 [Ideonella sp. 4Y11]|uniref:Uncharacterized protein n=1 Tax=Ideonella aquatica TaxID=2824119 RepID=A0A940YJ55_9BURK|nr:hypothetical protein [Ideonella aquatica]MBQ0961040.1 hypothetical protein [Ideonella aquatica]
MNNSILNPRRALTLLALASLTACGGGSNDRDTAPLVLDLAITDANADDVARVGLASTAVGPLAANLGTGLGAAGSASQVVALVSRRAQALGLKAASRVQPQAAAVVDCAVSGSVSVNFNDSNANGLFDAAGESISVSASACNDGSGFTLNGSFTMTLDSFTDARNFGFTMAFANLQTTTTEGSVRLGGDLAVQLSGGNTLDLRAAMIALQASYSGASYQFELGDYVAHVVDRGDAAVQRVSGTFRGTGLDNHQVRVTTPVDVVQRYADDYPSAGTMKFVGDAGSALKVDALNATQARLSVDANGDGAYETVRTVLWADLDR